MESSSANDDHGGQELDAFCPGNGFGQSVRGDDVGLRETKTRTAELAEKVVPGLGTEFVEDMHFVVEFDLVPSRCAPKKPAPPVISTYIQTSLPRDGHGRPRRHPATLTRVGGTSTRLVCQRAGTGLAASEVGHCYCCQ